MSYDCHAYDMRGTAELSPLLVENDFAISAAGLSEAFSVEVFSKLYNNRKIL